MKRKLLLIFLVIALLVSCSKSGEKVGKIEITDHMGRAVQFEKPVERIASAYYISTHMILGLGGKDNLVAVEHNAARQKFYKIYDEKIADIDSIGSRKELDLEKLLSLKPDVYIMPMKLKDKLEDLKQMGISAIVINPENEKQWKEAILMIAKCMGKDERGKELLDFYDEMKEKLGALKKDESKTVYLAGNSSFLSTAGSKMYQSSQIELAGGVNVAAGINDAYWAEISNEQFLQYDPEYIIMAAGAKYDIKDITEDPLYADMKAVKNGRVFKMPDTFGYWDSPIDSTILGSLWMGHILYPEQYSEEDLKADIDKYYQHFYQLDHITEGRWNK